METPLRASPTVVAAYRSLFVNRLAYTLQSPRPHPESGRHYYFRPRMKGTDGDLSLTNQTIRQHLEGEVTIGLYAINPATQRSKWVAIDADYDGAMEDLLKLQHFLLQDEVEAALEMSRTWLKALKSFRSTTSWLRKSSVMRSAVHSGFIAARIAGIGSTVRTTTWKNRSPF